MSADRQLIDVLKAAADFLYRQGCGEAACAVDEVVRRLEAHHPSTRYIGGGSR